MGARILSVKVVVASTAVLLSVVALHLATPAITKFLTAEAPRLYESVSAWLTPPYLYFVINGIIISIAATSHFQKPIASFDPTRSDSPATISSYANPVTTEYTSKFAEDDNSRSEFFTSEISSDDIMSLPVSTVDIYIAEGSHQKESSKDMQKKLEPAGAKNEKPPVYTRPVRRRGAKGSVEGSMPGGKPLGVARVKKHDTLENTWKTITDGRHVPLGRHLKKSDTWETRIRAPAADPALQPPAMLKAETFPARSDDTVVRLPSPSSSSRASLPSAGKLRRESSSGKLRRESSLGQDELNRRVEAFIRKFNEEMRLQRQNSLQQYLDMINCSNH